MPCVTDNSGLSTYGLNGLCQGDEHPAYAPSGVWSSFTKCGTTGFDVTWREWQIFLITRSALGNLLGLGRGSRLPGRGTGLRYWPSFRIFEPAFDDKVVPTYTDKRKRWDQTPTISFWNCLVCDRSPLTIFHPFLCSLIGHFSLFHHHHPPI